MNTNNNTEDMNAWPAHSMERALRYMKKQLATIEEDIAAFEKRAAFEAEGAVITAHGWCVVTDSLAILVKGEWTEAVHIEPHLCGFTCMNKADAESIAALRNAAYRHHVGTGEDEGPWEAVMHNKLAARQAADLRELKAGVEEAIRETEAYLAEKGVEA